MNAEQSSPRHGCPGCSAAPLSRREVLKLASNGFGMLALSALMAREGHAGVRGARVPHFRPRAKNVIFCFMDGGVSHVDTFDPKPQLTRLSGKTVEISATKNPTASGKRKWLGSPWKFKNHGGVGLPVSELFPHVAACADDLVVIRSMKGEFPLHDRASLLTHTGSDAAGRPSLGSWVTYGLGSESRNLPGYVVLHDGIKLPAGLDNFSNGFLAASHQPSLLKARGVPIDNIVPSDKSDRLQRAKLEVIRRQDRRFSASQGTAEAIESAIRNYQLAYRMQSLVPDVVDLSRESKATKTLYGIDSEWAPKRHYGIQCLRARRLVEAGVRFVEVTCPPLGGSTGTWDQHGDLKKGHEKNALATDQSIAGLLKDLKSRGLLDETLVLWSGEFGRTPHSRGRDGRDHHSDGYTLWMAGGGTKGGTVYGSTDEVGMDAVEHVVTLHDLHATILHLLGLDHEKLTFRFGGRDMRLTDVHGHVVHDVLA